MCDGAIGREAHAHVHQSARSVGKRLMDIGVTLVLLVATAPILALAALAIAVSSEFPIIHRRRVVGLRGKLFDAFKLRTMVHDADGALQRSPILRAAFEQNYKLHGDPRVTPVGALLRKWSIDELPQLVNVLQGQMSLVGPRMVAPEELAKYGAYADELIQARPGLSGIWQVSGRQALDYQSRVALDMDYLRTWSLGKDLKIALLTPWAVVTRKGAL